MIFITMSKSWPQPVTAATLLAKEGFAVFITNHQDHEVNEGEKF